MSAEGSITERNKEVVRRFNLEVIQGDNRGAFEELMSQDFVNHSAAPGTPNGPEGMWNTFHNVLHPALSEMTVRIDAQVAEGEMVTTRKAILGVHTGVLAGIAPTGRAVVIEVMDMVRVREGLYVEHWGLNTLQAVLAGLRGPAR